MVALDEHPLVGHPLCVSDPEHNAVVRRSFERQTRLFSGPNSPFAARSGTLAWIEPLDPAMIVLDVACGSGHASEALVGSVRQVVGIDLTTALLTLGADRIRSNGIQNLLLQEGDAEALPFADESFDLVFCRSSLHHFANPLQAVAEMVRVCRERGRIVLLDIVPPDAEVRDQFDHIHRLIDPSHVKSFLEPELADLLPGGRDALTYATTFDLRFPIDVALTEQSETDQVLHLLGAEVEGSGERSGLDPAEEDGRLVVSFTTSVVHGSKLSS
jgi:ubiquinone/menaquinone biosynthesis C-methylase UbiE